MSRPCVCGGSNENCRYCSGRGEIPDGLASALTRHSQRPESQKVRAGARGKRKVGKWNPAGQTVTSNWETQLAKFKRLSERIFTRRLTASHPALAAPEVVVCPRGCGAHLASRDLDSHIKKVHAATPSVHQKPGSKGLPSDSFEDYKHCPVCSVRVKAQRLKRHLRKVHSLRPKGVASGPNSVPSDIDVQRQSTTLIAPRDKNLDATKLYAHSFREHGRFGSHPSHDGFDDDSDPD